MELKETKKEEWKFKYRGVECRVVFWKYVITENGNVVSHYFKKGIWNSYFILREEHIGEDFKRFVCKRRKVTYKSGDRYIYSDYYKLPVEMVGGVTYYDLKNTNHVKPRRVVEFGNDYNHIWNDGITYTKEEIMSDLKCTVDGVLDVLKISEINNDYCL